MNVRALEIQLAGSRIGVLFQYPLSTDQVINRFVADDDFASDPKQKTLSLSFLAGSPDAQAAFWHNRSGNLLNGVASQSPERGFLLPAFFQNLLPEGPLREHVAALRKCSVYDHFEMLAATGKDLPGDVAAHPVELSREDLQHLITQDNDALEMSVTAEPLEEAISLSGVQAKLAVLKMGDRFVARTKLTNDKVKHVIAKLPVVAHAKLPELEHLSLQLARAAGVSTVDADLVPLGALEAEHGYDLGAVRNDTKFLAVYRYDRDAATPTGRVHCEDFAQILGVQPEKKYTQDYLAVATAFITMPSLGEPAVHELLRRILVNEMLGNPDMHLKNIGLRYPDGVTPELPPAYDIVGYAAYGLVKYGRALHLMADAPEPKGPNSKLTPQKVRVFCERLGLTAKPAWTALRLCAEKAHDTWPALIKDADITGMMQALLLKRLEIHRKEKG